MALELLDDLILVDGFDVRKHIDMWAFVLVLWAITRRTFSNGKSKKKGKEKLKFEFF